MNVMDDILERFDQQGPIDVHINEDEYVWLQSRAKALWQQASYWSARDQKLFLAFLRGYTFYREVSENENQFWATFHADLRIAQDLPTNTQYDTLWTALLSHSATAPYCHVSRGEYRTRRYFVRAIDAIWGIHSLSARQLMSFFDAYYNRFPGQRIDAALMRRLLPDTDDTTLRQAAAYDRLFRRMVQIVDYILETGPELAALPPQVLTQHLIEHGVEVGSPNPILYFANTTESGLARIVGLAGQGTRHRYRFTPLRTRINNMYAEAHLAPGYAMEGQPVIVKLQDPIGSTRQEVELRLATGQRTRILHGTGTFTGLIQGNYEGELYINGHEAGRSIEFSVLPEMSWILTHRNGPLMEGQWQVGTVTLADRRFGKFRWRPQWQATEAGFTPVTERVEIQLDNDLKVELDVQARSYGARILDPAGPNIVERLDSLDFLERLVIRPLVPQKTMSPAVRTYWGSAPEQCYEVNEGRHLQELAKIVPLAYDELIVEIKYGTVWYRVHSIPVEIPPTLVSVICETNTIRLCSSGTGTIEYVIREESDTQICVHAHSAEAGATASFPLQLPNFWEPRAITTQLKLGDYVVEVHRLDYTPHRDMRAELRELLAQGIGWARLTS